MNEPRKKVQAYILKVVTSMDPSGINKKMYQDKFDEMDDTQFDKWMKKLQAGEVQLDLYTANMKNNLRIADLIKTSETFNVSLFDHVEMYDPEGDRYYRTPSKYLIINVPVRRLKQTLSEKQSVPESDKVTSLQSGQVVGPSKGSSVSLIETQTLIGKRLNNVVDEFYFIRGGNPEAWATFSATLEETGEASIADVKGLSRPRAVNTAKLYLLTRMIDNNM